MTRRRHPAMAVLGLLGGLLGGLLAGCAPAAEDGEPRSAAELVTDAQQRVRFWNTGHVTVQQDIRSDGRRVTVVWKSDYDLGRKRWDATMGATGGRTRYRWVGTANRLYSTSSDQRGAELGKWLEQKAAFEAGAQPHLDAVLSFEAGQVLRREADGWSVAGTVPMSVALFAVGLAGEELAGSDIVDAKGTAPAVLLIGRDHEVRELRMRGATFDVTSPLPDELQLRLKDTSASITVSELGEHVQVDQPPAVAKILNPIPAATPDG